MSGPIGMTLQTKTLDRIISELTITKETGKGCVPFLLFQICSDATLLNNEILVSVETCYGILAG